MADAVIAIKIVTDAASAQRGMAAAGTGVGKMQRALSKMVVPAAAAVVAIGAFGKASFDAASRTQQAMGAVESVFGRNAGTMKKWADGAADSVGLAKSEYMELASVMGAQLKNMGLPMDQVAKKTNDLIVLGSDLAATYGGTTAEAVQALGGAFKGETDPLEKYAAGFKEADVTARMAAEGADKLTGKAKDQARAMAIMAILSEKTADAQGNFAKESNTAAGQAARTAAKYEDLKSTLGTQLLPVITKVIAALGKMVSWMQKNPGKTKAVIVTVLALSVAILVLVAALNLYVWATTSAAAATLAAWVAAIWPILLVVAAVALVVGAVVLLWKKCDWFRNAVKAVWAAVSAAAKAAANGIKAAWTATMNAIKTAVRAVGSAARSVWNGIKSGWNATAGAIKSAARAMGAVLRSVWNAIKGAIQAVIGVAQRLIAKIRSIKVPGSIRAAFNAIRGVIEGVIHKVGAFIAKLRGIKVPGGITAALNAIKSAAEKVADAIGHIIDKLRNIPVPHINWPSPPKWFGKLKPGSMLAPTVPPGQATGRYVAPTGRSGRLTSRAVPVSQGGPTIVVQGALDPEAVARQIQRLMGGHTRRMGGAAA